MTVRNGIDSGQLDQVAQDEPLRQWVQPNVWRAQSRAAGALRATGTFDGSKHPRDANGQFSSGGGGAEGAAGSAGSGGTSAGGKGRGGYYPEAPQLLSEKQMATVDTKDYNVLFGLNRMMKNAVWMEHVYSQMHQLGKEGKHDESEKKQQELERLTDKARHDAKWTSFAMKKHPDRAWAEGQREKAVALLKKNLKEPEIGGMAGFHELGDTY